MIKFDWKIFNPIYWHLQEALNNRDIRYIYLIGGSSAGKTVAVAQGLSIDTLANNNNQYLLRRHSVDLTDTIYNDFRNVTRTFEKFSKVISTYNRITVNDNILKFRGLDKSHRIQGLSSYKRVYLDEITHFNFDDFKQIRKRLRGEEGQQIIASWNPISVNHWINKKVLKLEEWQNLPNQIEGMPHSKLYSEGSIEENSYKKINAAGNMLLIKTTYRDNYWIVGHPKGHKYGYYDKHVIADFEYDKIHNPIDYDVYANGNWGITTDRLVFKPSEYTSIEHVPPEAKKIASGLDFGFTTDPTVIVDFYVLNNYLIWDERIYERDLTNIRQYDSSGKSIGSSIQQRLEEINFPKDQIIVAESSEPKSINELRNAGYQIFAVKKGGIIEGIKMLKSYHHLITKRSENVLYEFENYTKIMDKDNNILDEPMDKDNHAIDAGRYVQFMKNKLW